jgi:hypothetical protein
MYYDKSTDAFTFAMVERNSPNVGSVPIARIRADTTLEIKNVKVAPSSPEASWGKIYFKQNKPYAKVSSGLEYSLSSIGLGSTVIDSAKVVADTLKFYVGGTAYKAVK